MTRFFLLIAVIALTAKVSFAQTYGAASASSDKNYHIKNVSFAGIDQDSDKSSYTNYTSGSGASVYRGSTYTLSVELKDKKDDNYLTVWIDWNDDGVFNSSNEKYVMATNDDGDVKTTSITVPMDASLSETRMRLIVIEDNAPSPTGTQGGKKGEVEDYKITISTLTLSEDDLYYVSDANDKLYKINLISKVCTEIGSNGVSDIEAIANWPGAQGYVLYAANGGDLGTLSFANGLYTKIGEIDGGATANGSDGPQTLNDVDGLAFDARTGVLWASNRRSSYDLLFQINKETGIFVPNAFGPGIDYVVIDGVGIYEDIDDIAISPITGEMLVSNNDGGSLDRILSVNKSTGAVSLKSTFSGISDVEGIDFNSNGNFYGSEGSSPSSLNLVNTSDGSSTVIKGSLCGSGDVEALACLVRKANLFKGTLWSDTDEDGIKDAGETDGIANVTIKIYFDADNDGVWDPTDVYLSSVETDASGNWEFEYATTGRLIARVETSSLPSGYALTTANVQTANFVGSGVTDSGNNFGAIGGADCDNDGIPDFVEGTIDTDGDGVQNKCDLDSDNDGILDSEEGIYDKDGDGIPNYLDLDSDNDGITDAMEANGGFAPAGYSASLGRITGIDSDGDGLLNSVDAGSTSNLPRYDTDNDGVKDYQDMDSDNDGILDIVEAGGTDSNGDGQVDSFTDSNGNGYHDAYQSSPLPIYNNDSATEAVPLPNYRDIDSDGDSIDDTREGLSPESYRLPSVIADEDYDGVLNEWDKSSGGTSITPFDFDTDGVPDYQDLDSDNDSGSDMIEGNDANSDNIADSSPLGTDMDKNGLDDAFDQSCFGAASINVTASSHNEEVVSSGDSYLGSSDLELVYAADEDGQQIVGIRFANVNVSQGATISNANIQFEVDETSSGTVSLTLKAHDIDNAPDVSSSDYDISDRTTTSASVSWSPGNWTTVGLAGADQKTPNIASLIQEVVNRAGWESGNSIMIIISGSSTTNTRIAETDPILTISTSDGLKYNCGSDIAIQDYNSNTYKDFRDVTVVLPVSLIEFNANKVSGNVKLDWATASEENNDYFEVQRSTNAVDFEYIGRVNGGGNSNTMLNYEFTDYTPYDNINYYRLKQVDYDGSVNYSKTVVVKNISDDMIQIYPNPSNGAFVIDVKENVEVYLYNSMGQLVWNTQYESNSSNAIDLSDQPKGIYFISYIYNNQKYMKKVIIR